MDNENITIEEVIEICSKARICDGTLCFDAYGTSDIRGKTLIFLYERNISLDEAEHIINTLTRNELTDGPADNYLADRIHKIWIFLKKYKGMKLYIKLLIYGKRRKVAVISLHD